MAPSTAGVPGGACPSHGDGGGAHLPDGPQLPASCSGLPGTEAHSSRPSCLLPHPPSPLTSRPIPSQIFEAYGQTECTAGCTFTTPGDATSGSHLKRDWTDLLHTDPSDPTHPPTFRSRGRPPPLQCGEAAGRGGDELLFLQRRR